RRSGLRLQRRAGTRPRALVLRASRLRLVAAMNGHHKHVRLRCKGSARRALRAVITRLAPLTPKRSAVLAASRPSPAGARKRAALTRLRAALLGRASGARTERRATLKEIT